MEIPVMRYTRFKKLGDESSPLLVYLKRVPGHSRAHTIDDVAADLETIGSLSVEDVTHVLKAFARRSKTILAQGDKLKIDGFGTFYTTFNCDGAEEEKDCTVRNIRKINVRFAVDNTFRLVNDSTATTRGTANNMKFYIKGDAASNTNNGSDDDSNNPGGNDSGGGDEFIDPSA